MTGSDYEATYRVYSQRSYSMAYSDAGRSMCIAWQLLAIIVGIITQTLSLGAVTLMGLGARVLNKTLTFAAVFSTFGDLIPCLIVLAFFFVYGFIKTGLGNRIAYQFVSLFGSSSLGLGHNLVFSEALLALAILSISART